MSEIPENLSYTADHEWVGPNEGDGVKVGITDYAQDSLSDVVFVELPNVGDEYEQGEVMAVAESVKAASDIYAPIKGKITAVNEKLEESPELVNESPYGSGWMVQMEASGEMSALIDAESYKNSLD
jgi:glycine cleavage system H protein